MVVDVLSLLAPPLAVGMGLLTLTTTATLDGAAVAFDTAEIGVIAALLVATTGALSLVFRLLLASKEAQIATSEKRIVGLELLLSQTAARNADQERQLIDLLTGAVKSGEMASLRMADSLEKLIGKAGEQAERSTAEHTQIVRALETLTTAHERMAGKT